MHYTYPADAGINPMPWMEFAPDITYPAGAGINLGDGLDLKQIEYLPRMRGDKPQLLWVVLSYLLPTPQARG